MQKLAKHIHHQESTKTPYKKKEFVFSHGRCKLGLWCEIIVIYNLQNLFLLSLVCPHGMYSSIVIIFERWRGGKQHQVLSTTNNKSETRLEQTIFFKCYCRIFTLYFFRLIRLSTYELTCPMPMLLDK